MADDYCSHMADSSPLLNELRETKTTRPYDVALRSHYRRNRHHPEHFVDSPHDKMEPIDVKEMMCDHLACVCGPRWRDGMECSVEEAADFCRLRFEKWRGDYYDRPYRDCSVVAFHVRWPTSDFPEEERFVLTTWLERLVDGDMCLREFKKKCSRLQCVRFYCRDLHWHKKSIRDIVGMLFPEDDDLQDRAIVHDNDKWDPVSVAAYTLRWIFGVVDLEKDVKLVLEPKEETSKEKQVNK